MQIAQKIIKTLKINNLLKILGLFSLNKIADCKEIDLLISDVKEEVRKAEQYHLEKITTNYDMVEIIEEQKKKDRII